MEAMAGDERVEMNRAKFDDFVARRMEEQDAKRKRTEESSQGPRGR